ncbi:hypothetical protein YC2023_014887 [Brassica napus]
MEPSSLLTSWKSSDRRLIFQSSQKRDLKVNCKNNLCIDQTTSSTHKASPSTQNLKRK